MAAKVDLYNSSYGNYALVRTVRSGSKPMARTMARPAGLRRRSLMRYRSYSNYHLAPRCWKSDAGRVATPYISRSVSAARWWDSI